MLALPGIHACPICKQVYRCSFPKLCDRGDCSICLNCMISPDVATQALITGFNAEWAAHHPDE
jgi:hypothetical protein